MERDILHDAVALVEDAENGDALRHRRHANLRAARPGRLPDRSRAVLRLLPTAAGRERQHNQQCSRSLHYYSGIQGS
jgi:hypothetical protein